MVARSAYTQLELFPFLLFGTLVGLAVTFWGPSPPLVGGTSSPVAGGHRGRGGLFRAHGADLRPMVRYHRLGCWRAAGLPVVACLYGAMTVTSAWRHYRKGVAWKGRRYGRSSTEAVARLRRPSRGRPTRAADLRNVVGMDEGMEEIHDG